MLRLTSPQAARVERRDSLIFLTSGPRPDFTTPWNWMHWRVVTRRVLLPYWVARSSKVIHWLAVMTPPGMRLRIIMMYFLPVLRRSRSSCW